MTSLLHPPVFRVAGQHANRVLLASEAGATVEIFVLEDDIVRVRVLPDATARNPRTWSIAPGLEDVPLDGRDRLDLSGFALPSFTLVEDDDSVHRDRTDPARGAQARRHCTWSMRDADGTWRVALADRATQTYNFGWWDDRAYHYVARERGDKVFGLGERATSTAPARASRCATSTRWATARSTPTRCTSTFRFTSRGRPLRARVAVLRHAVGLRVRHGPRARQLSRLPLFRRRARRSRLLLHRVARPRRRAALHLAHRAPARTPKWGWLPARRCATPMRRTRSSR